MTVFASHGAWYCVWAEKVSVGKKISNLYIARMKSPHSLETKQVLLSSPDYDWERVDFWVNEGPAVIRRNGRICMTYSASATGAEYCMGLLSAEEDSDLLDPASWTKERLPVLVTDETAVPAIIPSPSMRKAGILWYFTPGSTMRSREIRCMTRTGTRIWPVWNGKTGRWFSSR